MASCLLTCWHNCGNEELPAFRGYVALWLNGPAGQTMVDLTMAATTALIDVLDDVYGDFNVSVVDAVETFGTFI